MLGYILIIIAIIIFLIVGAKGGILGIATKKLKEDKDSFWNKDIF